MITIILPDLRAGGAERVALYLANHWASQGLRVEMLLMQASGALLNLVDSDVSIHNLNVSRIRSSILPICSYLKERRPSVVWVGMWPLTCAAILGWKLAGEPGKLFTIDHVNLSYSCALELKISLIYLQTMLRFVYPLATGRMAVSEGVKTDLCELGGFSHDDVKVIYNPVVRSLDNLHYPCPDERAQLWGSGFSHHILSAGNFKSQKNFALLLRSFSMLPVNLNSKLTILGEGPLRPDLEMIVEELNMKKNVSLPGFTLNTSSWFRSADLFVLSSSWEGLPTVIIEALEWGVPVVSTNCRSGPAEILENGRYGRLVPVGDAKALASAIQASLLEQHDHHALRRRAQDFSVRRIADQYLTYFRSKGAQV